MRHRLPSNSQKGVALITTLLVVAAATIAAVSMVSRQQIDIRRTENMINRDQAFHYAYATEAWAGLVLEQDLENNAIDSPQDDWGTLLPPMIVEGGAVSGSIEDLQGRLNINNLVTGDGKPDSLNIARFQRLLQQFDIDPDLAHAVVDWIDSDIDPQIPYGAEDDYYLALSPAYRTANRPLVSISELRTIKGFTADIYHQIRPFLIALPERTALNINSAPAELLATLSDDLTPETTQELHVSQGVGPFESVNDFLAQDSLAGLEIDANDLSVASNYFLLRSDAQIARNRVQLQTILIRKGKTVTPVQRSFGTE